MVTRNGVPVGDLTPPRRSRFVSADAVVELFTHAPAIDHRQLGADLDGGASQGVGFRA